MPDKIDHCTLIFTILWMFSILTLNVSGTVKDRFVVRENHARLLKCEHNQENINGVKWLFVSNQTNESETVFDSQKKNNLNEGITSNCQNKFCNLKILSAKKEQSGTYFCYTIKDNNDNNMTLVTEIEIVVRGSKKETLIVSIGDSVVLLCEHNIRNVTRTRWSHVSIEGYHTYDFYYMEHKQDLDSNYEAHCEFHKLSCNLKIHKIDKQSAGKYICMHGDSLDYEEKFGLDEMTYFVEIEVVAGDLSCNENVPEDLTLLGENDCYRTMPGVLNLKCSFTYYGNIDENLVHMEWVEENEFNSSSLTSFTTFENAHNAKKISTQSNVSVSYNMMISTFKCALPETKVKHCQRHRFQVQYASNTTVRSPSIHSNELHSVKCLANISEKVQCSYYWVHEIGGAMLQNPYRILPAEHMNSPGVYTCLAKCNVEGNDHCVLKAMEFELIPRGSNISLSKMGNIIILILPLFFVAFFMFVVWFCLRKRFQDRTKRSVRDASASSSDTRRDILKIEPRYLVHADRSCGGLSSTGSRGKFLLKGQSVHTFVNNVPYGILPAEQNARILEPWYDPYHSCSSRWPFYKRPLTLSQGNCFVELSFPRLKATKSNVMLTRGLPVHGDALEWLWPRYAKVLELPKIMGKVTSIISVNLVLGRHVQISAFFFNDINYWVIGTELRHIIVRDADDLRKYEKIKKLRQSAAMARLWFDLYVRKNNKSAKRMQLFMRKNKLSANFILRDLMFEDPNYPDGAKFIFVTWSSLKPHGVDPVGIHPPDLSSAVAKWFGLETVKCESLRPRWLEDYKFRIRKEKNHFGRYLFHLDKNQRVLWVEKVKTVWYKRLKKIRCDALDKLWDDLKETGPWSDDDDNDNDDDDDDDDNDGDDKSKKSSSESSSTKSLEKASSDMEFECNAGDGQNDAIGDQYSEKYNSEDEEDHEEKISKNDSEDEVNDEKDGEEEISKTDSEDEVDNEKDDEEENNSSYSEDEEDNKNKQKEKDAKNGCKIKANKFKKAESYSDSSSEESEEESEQEDEGDYLEDNNESIEPDKNAQKKWKELEEKFEEWFDDIPIDERRNMVDEAKSRFLDIWKRFLTERSLTDDIKIRAFVRDS